MKFVSELFGSTKWVKDSTNEISTIEDRKKKINPMIKKIIEKFK